MFNRSRVRITLGYVGILALILVFFSVTVVVLLVKFVALGRAGPTGERSWSPVVTETYHVD